MSTPLPPLGSGAVPAAVQAEGPQAEERFRAALSFERVLLGELLSEALPEEESPLPSAATLPDTLADAIVAGGGAGLASELYEAEGPSGP